MKTHYFESLLGFECARPERNTDQNFDAFTDRIMDALCDLEEVDEGIIEPDISAKITRREVVILMGVVADTKADAARLYMANVRAALHAAGAGTPGWPEMPSFPEPRELETA